MKLYLWRAVFADYTSGMAMAIAENKEQAIAMAIAGHDFYGIAAGYYQAGDPRLGEVAQGLRDSACEEHDLTEPFGFAISGGG